MPVAFEEGQVTKLRREFKLLMTEPEATALCRRLLPSMDHATPQPTQVVSIYFDRPGLVLAHRAVSTPDNCLKVRTKEYFPDVSSSGRPRVVLEVKRERNGLTQKRRLWLPRAQLAAVMKDGAGSGLLPLIARGQLLPALAVTYQRYVYQQDAAWRVTVDRHVAFHVVTAETALSEERVTLERLGAAVATDERVVVEVKHLGEVLPDWLAALAGARAHRFSKFAEGMRRLSSARVDGAQGG